MVIHQAAPVPHLHHGGEAEDGLLVQAADGGHSEGPGSQLDGLVLLGPRKLLLPYLHKVHQITGELDQNHCVQSRQSSHVRIHTKVYSCMQGSQYLWNVLNVTQHSAFTIWPGGTQVHSTCNKTTLSDYRQLAG